jgi:diguanylate cyclase (GGDEF)-like protein/PAS domain S-box-containing protein
LSFIAFLSFALFPLLAVLGAFLLSKRRSVTNLIFSVVCFLFAWWAGAHGFYVLAPDKPWAWFWYRAASLGWLPGPFVITHFLIELTHPGLLRRRRLVFFILYVPLGLLLYRWLTAGFVLDRDIVLLTHGWAEVEDLYSPWALLFQACWCLYVVAGLGMVYRWGRRSHRPLEQRQARVILVSGLVGLFVDLVSVLAIPSLVQSIDFSAMSPLPMTVWLLGIWYSIVNYGLMRISPAMAAENILDGMTEPLLLVDDEHRVMKVNPAAGQLLSRPGQSLVGKLLAEVFPNTPELHGDLLGRLRGRPVRNLEIAHPRGGAGTTALILSATIVEDKRRSSAGIALIMRDVSEIKQAEENLRYLATHDPLTDLPNRDLLKDRGGQAFARARRNQTFVAVLLLDLDLFKQVNDAHGHETGDALLQAVASRLKCCVRASDTIARLGGDEFVLLLTDMKQVDDVSIGADRVLKAFVEPFVAGNHVLHLSASIGASIFPNDAEDIETLMKYADGAMYAAKEGGRNAFCRYVPARIAPMFQEGSLALRLRDGLAHGEFEVWYQPLYGVSEQRMVGTEALVRWRHPELGIVGPLDFLPAAEKSGVILPLGDWILRTACAQNQAWRRRGLPAIPVAVNISVRQLVRPEFVTIVSKALNDTGLPPEGLHLEITESTAVQDLDEVRKTLVVLDNMGVRIVIDDFGSGYSSLSRLKSLPIYALKIDQYFTRDVLDDPRDAAIVRAIVSLAHTLGIKVVAEGVETPAQLQFLKSLREERPTVLSCDVVQGYLFSRPVPAAQLTELLSAEGGLPRLPPGKG